MDRCQLTGTDTWSDISEGEADGVQLKSGWYVIVLNELELWELLGQADLLSSRSELLVASFEEHVMESLVQFWRDGVMQWSVCSPSGGEGFELQVQGSPPAELDAAVAKAKREEVEGEDLDLSFDVPADLMGRLTGFRYDEDPEAERADPFEELRPL